MLLFLTIFFVSALARPVLWVGAVTHNSANIRAIGFVGREFTVSLKPDLSNAAPGHTIPVTENITNIPITDLYADTQYYYGFRGFDNGTFRTFSTGPFSFKVVFGSCAASQSNAHTWKALLEEKASLFIHMGNMHYDAPTQNSIEPFLQSLSEVFDAPNQRAFYHSIPIAYTFGASDYGFGDNPDSTSPTREAALDFYSKCIPHYPLPNGRTGIVSPYHAWTIGRVRFIMPELRSEAVPNNTTTARIISSDQMHWLLEELKQCSSYSLMIIVSSRNWIGNNGWGLYPDDRKTVSNFIGTNNITNVLMLAGGGHSLGLDDGSYTDYSDRKELKGGFPLVHSAPLDRWGKVTGGPFSLGCYAATADYNEMYGVLEIQDTTESTCVSFVGKSGQETFFEWRKCTPLTIDGTGGTVHNCGTSIFMPWAWATFALAAMIESVFGVLGIVSFRKYFKKQTVKKYLILIGSLLFSAGGIVIIVACPLVYHAYYDQKTRPTFLPAHTSLVLLGLGIVEGCFLAWAWTQDFKRAESHNE